MIIDYWFDSIIRNQTLWRKLRLFEEAGAVCGLELQASAEASELLRQSSIATFVKLFNLDSVTSTTHVIIPASGE